MTISRHHDCPVLLRDDASVTNEMRIGSLYTNFMSILPMKTDLHPGPGHGTQAQY